MNGPLPFPNSAGRDANGPEGARCLGPQRAAAARGDRGGTASSRQAPLSWRLTADGSPSLWSDAFQQAFHCGSGALGEAQAKYIRPAQLRRLRPGRPLRVVEVCVGLGYNTACLLEAAADQDLAVEWWGLELDPRPLALALIEPRFRGLWRRSTLTTLEQLRDQGCWGQRPRGWPDSDSPVVDAEQLASPQARGGTAAALPTEPTGTEPWTDSGPQQGQSPFGPSRGRWLLGDARQLLPQLPASLVGRCDLVFLDAFSPGQCPQLWTQEFLAGLAALLRPRGRLLTYCTAAAVRRGLELAGLNLASLRPHGHPAADEIAKPHEWRRHWSAGTVASPTPLPTDGLLRPLDGMEREHLLCRAGVPYRDPLGSAEPELILQWRRDEQERERGLSSTSAWRRRWGLER